MRQSSRYRALVLLLLATLFLTTACDASSATASPPPPPTPTTYDGPPIHRLPLPHFSASALLPTAHGAVLYGAPDGQDPAANRPGTSPGARSLYYLDFASRSVTLAATAPAAPDGHPTVIGQACVAGDWLFYLVGDGYPAPFSSAMFAVNLVSHERRTFDAVPATWCTSDGTTVAWGSISDANTLHGWRATVTFYSSTTGASRTLSVQQFDPRADALWPVYAWANYGDSLVLAASTVQGSDSVHGTYVWAWGAATSPQQLTASPITAASMNERYVAWGDIGMPALMLFDRRQGAATPLVPPCIRPALAPDRPYAVCLDYAHGVMRLVHLPDGRALTLGAAGLDERGAIANGRAYWIETTGHSDFGSTLDYIDIPSQ